MKNIILLFAGLGLALPTLFLAGCAGNTQRNETLLLRAGFKPVMAQTANQEFHLKTLPVNQVTAARFKGKTFYVFPEPAKHRILVGNAEQYQTYQQVVAYSQIAADNRAAAAIGQESGADDDRWAEWTSNSGWTYGNN